MLSDDTLEKAWSPKSLGDLRGVKPSEIRSCLWQIYRDDHPIYKKWSHMNTQDHESQIILALNPLTDACNVKEYSFGSKPEKEIANPRWEERYSWEDQQAEDCQRKVIGR